MEKPSKEHTTEEKRDKLVWLDQYIDIYTFKTMPVTERWAVKISEDLVNWAKKNEDAFKLTQFCEERGIPYSTFKTLVNKFPCMKIARDAAVMIIGNRREIGGLKNKLNTTMVMSQMAKYDDEWWSLEQRRAKLKAESQPKSDENVRYTIVVDSYADKAQPSEKEKDGKETKPEI